MRSALVLLLLCAGCGSYGRGHYASGPPDYFHQPKSVLTFVRWPVSHPVVTFRVNGGNAHMPFVESPHSLAVKGSHAWDNALTGRLVVREAAAGEAEDITISFVPRGDLDKRSRGPLGDLLDGPVTQGLTELTYVPGDPAQHLAHADVFIDRSLLGDRIREIAAHEIGHAIGIRGHSPFEGDLMFVQVPHTSTPSPRDVTTIRLLYPPL